MTRLTMDDMRNLHRRTTQPTTPPHRLYEDVSVREIQAQCDIPTRTFRRQQGPPTPAQIAKTQRAILRHLREARRPLYYLELAQQFTARPGPTGWSRRDHLAAALANLMDQEGELLTGWDDVAGHTILRFTLARQPGLPNGRPAYYD